MGGLTALPLKKNKREKKVKTEHFRVSSKTLATASGEIVGPCRALQTSHDFEVLVLTLFYYHN